MPNSSQRFGRQCESLAVEVLKKSGYRIIAQNYRTKMGEIDIIARDGETIVFVEVKARRGGISYGHPKYAVTRTKQRKISKAALYYLKGSGQMGCRARFDVVAVVARSGEKMTWEIVRNAFALAYG